MSTRYDLIRFSVSKAAEKGRCFFLFGFALITLVKVKKIMQWQQIPFEGNNCCASQADLVRAGTVWGCEQVNDSLFKLYLGKKKIIELVNHYFSKNSTRNSVGVLP